MKTRLVIASIAAIAALGVTASFAADGMSKADTDGDGYVTKDEFKAAHEARMETRFARIDADGDGLLSDDEISAMHENRRQGPPGMHKGRRGHKMNPEKMVERIDADGSGGVSLAELQGKPFSPDAETFQEADTDASGELDPAELKAMMKAHKAERRARDSDWQN